MSVSTHILLLLKSYFKWISFYVIHIIQNFEAKPPEVFSHNNIFKILTSISYPYIANKVRGSNGCYLFDLLFQMFPHKNYK